MVIWDIDKLKRALIHSNLPERDTFRYLMALIIIGLIPLPSHLQDGEFSSTWLINLIITFCGILYCYKKNMGDTGSYFLSRFVSISFVVSVRLFCIFLPFALVLIFSDMFFEDTEKYQLLYKLSLNVLFYLYAAFYYWRVGYHIGEISGEPLSNSRQEV